MGLFSNKKKILLHGNIVESEPGRFVAFFDEFPEIVAQGANKEETKDRLFKGLITILQNKKNKSQKLAQETFESGTVSHFELTADF